MLTKISDYIFLTAFAQDGTAPNFFDFSFITTAPGDDAQTIFNTVLGRVLGWVLAIIFLIAFIYLIISGVKYITSGGDAAKATEARNGVLNAIIGIVIVLLAYVIVRFAGTLGTNIGGSGVGGP